MSNESAKNVCAWALLVACFLLLVTAVSPVFGRERPIRIGGTGGALGIMKKLAAEYQRTHPGVMVTVLPSTGSSGGIKAVLANALDVAVSSRPLTEAEQGAVARALGRTPLVFATAKQSASGFTLEELVDIYAGRNERWPDGRPIRLVLRPASEFDTMVLKSMSPDMDRAVSAALARKGMIRAVTDQDSADAIAQVPGALGTITLAQIISEDRQVKALSLNGVTPGLGTLRNGSYPYSKTYHLVTKREPARPVREFVDFVLSAQGRDILSRSGCEVVAH